MRKKLPFEVLTAFGRVRRVLCVLALGPSLMALTLNCFAQAQLLKDINTNEQLIESEYSQLRPASGIMYFGGMGQDLWRTTGTPGGTSKIKDFNRLRQIATIGSSAFFVADDGVHGFELWKSNGTAASTALVKDITPGATGTEIETLTNVNGILFFVARTALGKELWKSDGTAAGTVMVKDILKSTGSSNPSGLVVMNGILYFSASDGTHGYELWKSDGTAAGTVMVKDIRPELKVSSQPLNLAVVNNTLFFTAILPEVGRELWKTDGTDAGTVLVKDVYPGTGSSSTNNLTNVNGTLFFSANDGVHGQELWKSDGTASGTVLVKDMTPGSRGSNGTDYLGEPIGHFTNIAGTLFFLANENGWLKVWKSNGTAAGTISLGSYQRIGFNYAMPAFTALGSKAFYFNGTALHRVDPGSTTPVVVRDFEYGIDMYEYQVQQMMVTFNNTLFFNAIEGGGLKLFKSTGTAAGTTVLKDIFNSTRDSDPYIFATANNYTLMMGGEMYGENASTQLWSTDGTPEGTIMLHESEYMEFIAADNNVVYFFDYVNGYNLWKTDGTQVGTVKVSEGISGYIFQSAVINNILYFYTNEGALFRSDGTEAGTYMLLAQHASEFYPAGNELYFKVTTGNSWQLWRTNGTIDGTTMIKSVEISTTLYPWARERSAYLNGVLYFLAYDLTHGVEVWRSDGTAAGTYMFADLNTLDNNRMGSWDFDIASLNIFNNNLYISALDNSGVWGLYQSDGVIPPTRIVDLFPVSNMVAGDGELYLFATDSHTYPQAITQRVYLWVTDGTAAGTVKLNEDALAQNIDYELVNGVLYYASTMYSYNNGTLYRSDGTACGTFVLNTGVTGGTPLESVNGKLIFSAIAPYKGREPHAFDTALDPGSSCAAALAQNDSNTSLERTFSNHPNPFTSDFTLKVESAQEEVQVKVYTANGFPVQTIDHVRTNIQHNFGGEWPSGVYILKIIEDDRVTTQRVMKK
jgi:ELWxxDGT repeat protein